MKKYILCFALVSSSQVAARDASVQVYVQAQPSTFKLLVPARSDTPVRAETASDDSDESLATAFEALTPPVQFAPTPPPIDVPLWMRRGSAGLYRFRLQQMPRASVAGCTFAPYQPFAGLSASGEARRRLYYREMTMAACEAGVPVELFDSLIVQESRYNPRALSPVGAIGMAQLMPGTARDLRVRDPWDVAENLSGGARYLRQQLDEFGSWHLALSAYNAGPGSVRRHQGIPPYRETTNYVRTIMASLSLNRRWGERASAPSERRVAQVSFSGS